MVHMAIFWIVLTCCLTYVMWDYRGKAIDGKCLVVWGLRSLLVSFSVVIFLEIYLCVRCCFVLLRTHHRDMHTWAYRLIAGFGFCLLCSLAAFVYVLMQWNKMHIATCLVVYSYEALFRASAVRYFVVPSPTYKNLDKDSDFGASRDKSEDGFVVQNRCPSYLSRAAPSFRTSKLSGMMPFAQSPEQAPSITLGAGATADGISAYLAQVASPGSESASFPAVRPRHISLLPSHPGFNSKIRPVYSLYPVYSTEDLEADMAASAAISPVNSPLPPSKYVAQPLPASVSPVSAACPTAVRRASLYSCSSSSSSSDSESSTEEIVVYASPTLRTKRHKKRHSVVFAV